MKHPVSRYVVERVRGARIDRGLTIAEMAKRTGIPLGSYSCLETGRYRLSLDNLFLILGVLRLDLRHVWPRPAADMAPCDPDYASRSVALSRDELPKPFTIHAVIFAACRSFGVPLGDLRSSSRRRHLSDARSACAVLVSDAPHLRLVCLARDLGRDVSSMSHAVRRARSRIEYDADFRLRLRRARRWLHRREWTAG